MYVVENQTDLKFQIILVSILLLAMIVCICEIITTNENEVASNTQETVGIYSVGLDPMYTDDTAIPYSPSSFSIC